MGHSKKKKIHSNNGIFFFNVNLFLNELNN